MLKTAVKIVEKTDKLMEVVVKESAGSALKNATAAEFETAKLAYELVTLVKALLVEEAIAIDDMNCKLDKLLEQKKEG